VAQQHQGHDVVVVGAGVIGLACAWRCAQRGMRVLVLEREHTPGEGASGVAAGMLAPVTEAGFGEEPLLRLNLASAALWPSFAAELAERSGLATGYCESGALAVAADRDDAEELRRLFAFQRQLGLDARWLGGRECRRLEPRLSPRVPGGILSSGDHHVEPRAVVAALATALRAAGGELRCGVEVHDPAAIDAPNVVLASGCWSGAPVRPVKGQILRLRGGQIAARLVRTPRCYVVSRAGGETVVGATMEERGFDTTVTADGVFGLLEAAREVLPDVGELEFVEAAARLRPGTPDNAPLIGERDGVIWATGHHRNGVLLAPITASAVAAMVAGEPPPEVVEPFGAGRFERAVA
jgi:glycine oxidase